MTNQLAIQVIDYSIPYLHIPSHIYYDGDDLRKSDVRSIQQSHEQRELRTICIPLSTVNTQHNQFQVNTAIFSFFSQLLVSFTFVLSPTFCQYLKSHYPTSSTDSSAHLQFLRFSLMVMYSAWNGCKLTKIWRIHRSASYYTKYAAVVIYAFTASK